MGAIRPEEVLSQLRDAVIVLDSSRRVEAWLGACEAIFGWPADEAVGKQIDQLLRPRDTNENPCCIGPTERDQRLSIIKGKPELEVLAATKGGGDIWVGASCAFKRDQRSKIVRSFVVARDITRRKRVDLEKSEVISAVSHELRSPLTSVKGFTSTLLNRWDRLDDEQKRHLLYTINDDADRVTRLIGELLDFSRIELGRVILRRQMCDVGEIAKRVADRAQNRSPDHRIETRFEKGFPKVFADPDKLEQILTNLVENAVKHTQGGLVGVAGELDESKVRVAVSDEGHGVPQEQRQSVFGKFYRRGERAGDPTGVGLGLYISKGLVEAHGGRIWVEDAPGGGALFAFTLPISAPEESR